MPSKRAQRIIGFILCCGGAFAFSIGEKRVLQNILYALLGSLLVAVIEGVLNRIFGWNL